jgi:hypothetical protein
VTEAVLCLPSNCGTPGSVKTIFTVVVCQGPPALRSCIFSHLKPSVDGSNCAPAARHALGDFEHVHFSVGEECYDSFYLLFTERTALSSHIYEASAALPKEYGVLESFPDRRMDLAGLSYFLPDVRKRDQPIHRRACKSRRISYIWKAERTVPFVLVR